MNQISPNKLGENIRIANSDFAEINIVEFAGSHYVTDTNIDSFMEAHKLTDKNSVLDFAKESNGINEITILDESTSDAELSELRSFMMIYESLNPFSVASAAKGRGLLRSLCGKLGEFITGHEYDEEADMKKFEEKCDEMLKDIAEEKKKIRSGQETDQLKFSAMYIFNLAVSLFITFCIPLVLSNEKIKMPAIFTKIFLKNKRKAIAAGKAVNTAKKASKFKVATGVAMTGFDLATSLPPDIKGLYLSFKDYDELLSEYENQIRSVKNDLIRKQGKIERAKEMKGMVEFVEDTTPEEAVSVNYQTPEELKVKNDHTPDVVHDDSTQQMEVPAPVVEPEAPPAVQEPVTPPQEPQMEKPVPVPPAEFSPLDAINQANKDPLNIPVAMFRGKYYVNHEALRNYMNACGETKYESAIENIIKAYDDPKICFESVRVVLSNNDMSSISPEVKTAMEESSVEFEVYTPSK